eukprot:GHVL01005233.1.p1 GENE.GHVL01005233.1~~GHVL01005233.1.p1  ORF type:complete len:107 (+),score=23.89 GHVL01005233.1:390-710(+)
MCFCRIIASIFHYYKKISFIFIWYVMLIFRIFIIFIDYIILIKQIIKPLLNNITDNNITDNNILLNNINNKDSIILFIVSSILLYCLNFNMFYLLTKKWKVIVRDE